MKKQFDSIEWDSVAALLGAAKPGTWYKSASGNKRYELHMAVPGRGYLDFFITDNGGEVNLTGLNWEAPNISVPYTAYGEVIPEEALAYRIGMTVRGLYDEIDWDLGLKTAAEVRG